MKEVAAARRCPRQSQDRREARPRRRIRRHLDQGEPRQPGRCVRDDQAQPRRPRTQRRQSKAETLAGKKLLSQLIGQARGGKTRPQHAAREIQQGERQTAPRSAEATRKALAAATADTKAAVEAHSSKSKRSRNWRTRTRRWPRAVRSCGPPRRARPPPGRDAPLADAVCAQERSRRTVPLGARHRPARRPPPA